MKRRIIALFLVVVTLTLTLASCSYNYSKKDMSEFATFDKAKFEEGMKALKVEDGDFTTNEDVRRLEVVDYIYEKLAAAADTKNQVKTGTVGAHDVLYYTYYATGVIEGVTYTFFANSMEAAKAAKFQLGLSDLEGINKLISDNLPADADLKDFVYDTKTDGTVAAGDRIYVSYNKSYTVSDSAKSFTVKYDELTVPTAEGGADFLSKIIGKEVGKKFSLDDKVMENIEGADVEVTYSDITVHWVVKSGAPIVTFEDVTYTATKKVAPVETTESKELKDVKLTYYVYPVYVNTVAEISGGSIITDVFGKNLTVNSLPMFKEEAYSSKIEAIAKVLKELSDEKTQLDKDIEARDKAQKTVDDAGDKATEAQKTALENAKTKVTNTENKVKEKRDAIAEQLPVILAVENTTGEDIVAEYKDYVYDTLEESYNDEIIYALADKIYHLILDTVTVNSYPKKAVDEAYDILMDGYKSTFYTGSGNYAKYNGSFKSFLVAEKKVDDYDAALAAVEKEAKEHVEPVIKIFAVAQALNADFEVLYTNKDYKQFIKENSDYYEEYYGEFNVRAAQQIDKILDYYLEIDYNEEDEIDYVGGYLPFVKITYTVTDNAAETK